MKGANVLLNYTLIAGETEVRKQIFQIVQTLIQLVYISAGMFMIVENTKRRGAEVLDFHTSIYFVVVTLSTVGYGDINPVTDLGNVMVLAVILMTIVIIPRQTN